MNTEPLKQLKDLHLPDPIGTWPLAYGWYIAILITLALVLSLSYAAFKARKASQAKRLALKALKKLEINYLKQPDASQMAYQLTVLLKRVCFAYYPREKIASLHSQTWHKFLGEPEWNEVLMRLSYQKSNHEDLSLLFTPIKNWIKTCNKRELNV